MDRQDEQWRTEAAERGVMRRTPIQKRSWEKVVCILDTAEALLGELGYEAMVRTPALILERAGVTGGVFYAYFENVEAVIDALSLRYLARVRSIIDELNERPYASWEEASDVIVDAYAAHFYRERAARELWVNNRLSTKALAADREVDRYMTARLQDLMSRVCGLGVSNGGRVEYEVLNAMLDQLLRLAFRNDPQGDPEFIAQAKAANRAYLATFLPLSAEPR